MGKSEGTSGEDIGRPGPWGEGRYQKPGQSVDESVRIPPGSVPDADKRASSKPVTGVITSLREAASSKDDPESPGGDALTVGGTAGSAARRIFTATRLQARRRSRSRARRWRWDEHRNVGRPDPRWSSSFARSLL